MDVVYTKLSNISEFNSIEFDEYLKQKNIELNKDHLKFTIDNSNVRALEYFKETNKIHFCEEMIEYSILSNNPVILTFLQTNIENIDLQKNKYLELSVNENKFETFNYLLSKKRIEEYDNFKELIIHMIDTTKIIFLSVIFEDYLKYNFDISLYEHSLKINNKKVYEYFENMLFENSMLDIFNECIKLRLLYGLRDFNGLEYAHFVEQRWLGTNNSSKIEHIKDIEFLQRKMLSLSESTEEEFIEEDELAQSLEDLHQFVEDNLFLKKQLETLENSSETLVNEEEDNEYINISEIMEDIKYVKKRNETINDDEYTNFDIDDNIKDIEVMNQILISIKLKRNVNTYILSNIIMIH